jgi:hypothetical protein
LQNTIHILADFVVPKPKHRKSLRFQPNRSLAFVRRRRCVLAAVELDDQLMLEAGKIHDVLADGGLPTKLCAVKLAAPDAVPEASFDLRLVFSQAAG